MRETVKRVAGPVARLVTQVTELAVPSVCAGCASAAGPLCAGCRATLLRPARPHRVDPYPPGLPPVYVVADYADDVRRALVHWKDRGRRDLARPLGAALSLAVQGALERRVRDATTDVSLVPIPSSRAARRRRGEDVWRRVVGYAAADLRGSGYAVRLEAVLSLRRTPADQAGLNARDRRRNLAGALQVSGRPKGAIIVVDDVVTTGATVSEACRALASHGCRVSAVAAIAGTRRMARR